MATCFSILTWKSPWTEEPDRLQSMGLQRLSPPRSAPPARSRRSLGSCALPARGPGALGAPARSRPPDCPGSPARAAHALPAPPLPLGAPPPAAALKERTPNPGFFPLPSKKCPWAEHSPAKEGQLTRCQFHPRAPQLEETPETPPSSRAEGLHFLHSLRSSSCLGRKPPRAPQLEETPETPPSSRPGHTPR